MEFSKIIESLGIESFPPELEEIYNKGEGVSNFTADDIDALERDWHIIGGCRDALADCLEKTKKNEALWEFTKAAATYLTRTRHAEGFALKLPSTGDAYPDCYFSALLLVIAMPEALNNYLKRGFPREEIIEIVAAFKAKLNAGKSGIGNSFNWLRHYTSSVIYKTSLFGITPRIIAAPIMLLKNSVGEYRLMMTDGVYHKDGKVLGSAGYTDTDGSFNAEFSEDEQSYTGNLVVDSAVQRETTRLEKSEWTVVAKTGDGIAAIHIPRGAKLTDDVMNKSFREAFKIMVERYPDYNPKMVHCSSWLVDPKLAEILGPTSNIAHFISRFMKYPIKSGGKELFGFAFPSGIDSYEDLPEDTSLQRKLKKLYLDGGFIHAHAGFVTDIDIE